MQEEKSSTDGVTPTKEDAARDATSKETVSDLKESNEPSGSKTGGESSSAPSPDGQFDSPRDGAGPGDETGPM